MNKTIWIIIVLVILVGLGYWIFGRGYTSTTPTTTNSTSQSSTPTSTSSVSIASMAFSPSNLVVKKGTQVTWTNNDSVAHTIVESDSKTGPSSSTVTPGKTYSFAFDTAGTYSYHCTIHPSMTGTVTVTD